MVASITRDSGLWKDALAQRPSQQARYKVVCRQARTGVRLKPYLPRLHFAHDMTRASSEWKKLTPRTFGVAWCLVYRYFGRLPQQFITSPNKIRDQRTGETACFRRDVLIPRAQAQMRACCRMHTTTNQPTSSFAQRRHTKQDRPSPPARPAVALGTVLHTRFEQRRCSYYRQTAQPQTSRPRQKTGKVLAGGCRGRGGPRAPAFSTGNAAEATGEGPTTGGTGRGQARWSAGGFATG